MSYTIRQARQMVAHTAMSYSPEHLRHQLARLGVAFDQSETNRSRLAWRLAAALLPRELDHCQAVCQSSDSREQPRRQPDSLT